MIGTLENHLEFHLGVSTFAWSSFQGTLKDISLHVCLDLRPLVCHETIYIRVCASVLVSSHSSVSLSFLDLANSSWDHKAFHTVRSSPS